MNYTVFKSLYDKNSKVVLTGANGFLGLEILKFFISINLKVICLDKKVNNLLKIKKKTNKIYIYRCDFNLKKNREKVFKKIANEHKDINILINNAAMVGDSAKKGWLEKIEFQSLELWRKAHAINIESAFHICQILGDNMKLNPNSCIVNISSIYGKIAPDFNLYKKSKIYNPVAYSVTKSSLIHLTKILASYYGSKIRVNCISPGGIYRNHSKKFIKDYSAKTPLARMANEDDILNTIIFLTSNLSSYVTGQNLMVDGGRSII